jgi:Tol biopolymer transport system component
MAPAALDHIVRKCLAKDPEERWQSAHDVASELKWISEQTSQSRTAPVAKEKRISRNAIAWLFSGFVSLIAIASIIAAYHYFRIANTIAGPEVTQLSFQIPEKTTLAAPGSLAISPDGRQVAFCVTSRDGLTTLWYRSLNSKEAHQLSGTSDASYPFWSPDSRYIGFFAQGKLKKIDVNGGPPQTICDASQGRGGSWNSQGKILFCPSLAAGLHLVASTEGATLSAVTIPDLKKQENSHRWPNFLPDGNHFLFTIRSAQAETRGVYIGSLSSKDIKRLLPDQGKAEYVSPGYIMLSREGNLLAVPFDSKSLQISGEPIGVAEGVDTDPGISTASFSVSSSSIIYMNSGSLQSQLFWLDRSGKQLSVLGKPTTYFQPVLSPDGKKVSVGIPDTQTGGYDVWISDLARGTFSRLTTNPASDNAAIWSPDETKIFFTSNRIGVFDLYEKEIGGSGEDRLLLHTNNYKATLDCSPDGRYLLFQEINAQTNSDLWILPLFGDRKPFPYLRTEFNDAQAVFSPDGKWIAYASDDTGRPEIYVQSFPVTSGTKRQVSTSGGVEPLWRKDQKELYYLAVDTQLMAVPISMDSGFEPGTPTSLFETHFSYNSLSASERTQYAVSADGKQFLLNNLAKQSSETPVNLILNWTLLLKK